MDLYLLRHGKAEERKTSDEDRRLAPAGRKEMVLIARRFRAMRIDPDLILSSPLVRARQTAEIVARVFHLPVRIHEGLAPGGNPRALISEASRISVGLCVGHEPDLSRLASVLVTGRPSLALTLKKGGIIRLHAKGRLRYGACAELQWLLPPSMLRG